MDIDKNSESTTVSNFNIAAEHFVGNKYLFFPLKSKLYCVIFELSAIFSCRYDHLADVLQTILRSKIPNAVEEFEELSRHVKKIRLAGSSTLTEVFEIGEDLKAYIKEKQMFYKVKNIGFDTGYLINSSTARGAVRRLPPSFLKY